MEFGLSLWAEQSYGQNKVKKIALWLILISFLIACQQSKITGVPTITSVLQETSTIPISTASVPVAPTSELVPYYGTPEPVKVIINGNTYDSEIGTTRWIFIDSDGNQVMGIGDAFAIITPKEPIVTTSDFSLVLKFPIPVNPTEL